MKDSRSRFPGVSSILINVLFEGGTDIRHMAEALAPPRAFDADRPLMLIQGSGSTGVPKRLLLTHRHMAARNRILIEIMGLTPADRYLQVPSLQFLAGRRRCLSILMLGATVVLNRTRTLDDYLRYFSDGGITYVYFTPYHVRSLLANLRNNTPLWPNLKLVISAAPFSHGERLLARQKMTPLLFESYGTNEVGDLALASPADQDRYPDSIGRVIAAVEAQVVDHKGAVLSAGQTGLIGFRADHFPREYFGNPEATTKHFRDGWFYPDDLAALNEEGYIFLKGRADDVINNAGAKYFPAEVEAALLAHPSVIDAAVIGGPHPVLGEVSVAYVVRSSDISSQDLCKFCDGKISPYKAPAWVFFLNGIPKIATGKPDKKKLKEWFRQHLQGLR